MSLCSCYCVRELIGVYMSLCSCYCVSELIGVYMSLCSCYCFSELIGVGKCVPAGVTRSVSWSVRVWAWLIWSRLFWRLVSAAASSFWLRPSCSWLAFTRMVSARSSASRAPMRPRSSDAHAGSTREVTVWGNPLLQLRFRYCKVMKMGWWWAESSLKEGRRGIPMLDTDADYVILF